MPRFNNEDRARVISELERLLSVELTRVGRHDRVLHDQNGNLFWVLGGYGGWHGATGEMIRSARKHPGRESVLIIARRYPARVDLYAGSLQMLVQNQRKLRLRANDNYQFNVRASRSRLGVKEIDGFFLDKIGDVRLVSEVEALRNLISRMSSSERQALLSEFGDAGAISA